jgi:hypothetical protein
VSDLRCSILGAAKKLWSRADGAIVRTWGAPFEAQGLRAVLRPYTEIARSWAGVDVFLMKIARRFSAAAL